MEMTSKSKTKGSSWERDIVKDFSRIFNSSFLRTPSSGAFLGKSNKVRKEILHDGQIRIMKGDIIPPDNWKYFNCEAKNYADFPFHQLIQDECKQLETWLSQLMDVSDPDDLNILIFKITRKGKYVAVQNNIDWDHSSPYIYYKSSTHNDWKIFDYDNFLEYNASLIEYISTLGITGYIHLK